jgi:predicted YcjX-like family ATPase
MGYPAWSDAYARDVVSLEAQKFAEQLNNILVNAMPSQYVSDPGFDFGAHESDIDLVAILQDRDSAKLMDLNQALSQLMENFGAHSRNLLRGILRASTKP